MRTSKKFIAGISAFIVAVSSVAITVSAVNTDDVVGDLTVSVSTVDSVQAGEEFTVEVNVSNIPETGIAGFEFAVTYDADSVEFKSITENTSLSGTASDKELELVSDLEDTMVNGDDYSCFDYYVNEETGKIACMWATGLESSDYWINEDGVIATIVFVAKSDINVDSVEVGVDSILDDGSVIFATADADGNYSSYEGLTVADPVKVTVSSEGDVTDATTEPDTTTTADEGDDTSVTTTEDDNTPGDSDDVLYGDVNCDGTVDGRDLLYLKKYSLGLVTELSAQAELNADVTHDGSVDGRDLLKLKKFSLGLVDSLDE